MSTFKNPYFHLVSNFLNTQKITRVGNTDSYHWRGKKMAFEIDSFVEFENNEEPKITKVLRVFPNFYNLLVDMFGSEIVNKEDLNKWIMDYLKKNK